MSSSYEPLTTVPEASVQAGLTIKELNKLIKGKVIIASKIGGKTLYVHNLSLAEYIELNGGQVERYVEALAKAILKAKADKILEKANLLIKIEKNILPKTYAAIRYEKIRIFKIALKETMDNLTNLSDKEYAKFLKKEFGSIVDTKELRQLIEMAKKDKVVFTNPSNEELLIMGAIIKKYNKNNTLLKKLLKKGFTTQIIDKYYDQDKKTLQAINKEGFKFDITDKKNKAYYEFFKTYKSIKEDYNTKIDYPLDKSVIVKIETELREKFHIVEGVSND